MAPMPDSDPQAAETTRLRLAQEETSLFSGTEVKNREDYDGTWGAPGMGADSVQVQSTCPLTPCREPPLLL